MSETTPSNYKLNKTRLITTLLGTIVLALLGWYLYQNRDVFSTLENITARQIVMMVLLEVVIYLLGSFLNYSMIRRFDFQVSYLDSVMLQYSNSFLNKVMPTIGAGAAFRAVYLKKKYQFPYAQFLSTLGGLYLINFVAIALIGLFCMLVFYLQEGQTNWVITLAFLALLLPSLFIAFFSPEIPEKDNRIVKTVRSIASGWIILKQDRFHVWVYTFVVILMLFLAAWQMLISFQSLGVRTGLIPVLFLSSLWIILSFLNFTPDGIGVREVVYVFVSNLVQIPDTILVLGSLVLRGLSICTSMVIGGISYWYMLREIRMLEEKEE